MSKKEELISLLATKDSLENILITVYNKAIEDALEEVYSTIDDSRDNISKLKITQEPLR